MAMKPLRLLSRWRHSLPHVLPTEGVPIHLYAEPSEVEPAALAQLHAIACSGAADAFVAAMPDVHLGKGAAVGSVYASRRLVAPNGVGVDIGCGMAAVPVERLWRDDLRPAEAEAVQRALKARVPVGFHAHRTPLREARRTLGALSRETPPSAWLASAAAQPKVEAQLGSLGGGNHFLEVLYDETGQLWLMLHSGSRWIGNHTAEHYNGLAMEQMRADGRRAASGREGKNELNSLRIDSAEGQAYLQDMLWCQAYALANRHAMLELMCEVVQEVMGRGVERDRLINTHHNFCACETCTYTDPATKQQVTEELWVTRKGATSARKGEAGLIPGSMGAGSFVVEGKGEARAWNSCSHGAGRKLSRTAAFKEISQEDFEQSLRGIVCDRDVQLRDEAPQAYKDLNVVMQNQESLVEIKHRLLPLINVKGIDKKSPQLKKATKSAKTK